MRQSTSGGGAAKESFDACSWRGRRSLLCVVPARGRWALPVTEATYRSVNRAGWGELTQRDSDASRPYGPEEFAHARQWLDPAGWLPWRRFHKVLCLAAGGGQQGPLFASLGYEV